MTRQNQTNNVEGITDTESSNIQNNSWARCGRAVGRTIGGGLMGALAGASFSLIAASLAGEMNGHSTLNYADLYNPLCGMLTGGSAVMGAMAGYFKTFPFYSN